MSSVSNWLAELGLERYLGAFEDAEVDFETLPELCEDDLKELGLPLGPRRKIWTALNRMRAEAALAAGPEQAKPGDATLAGQAERRHLTVMFVDLVGSTQLSMRLDAEDMREVISQYQNTIATVVSGFEGFVATLMGDGVLCYFGWPRANEDDTERAVRAGLAAIEATTKITTPDGAALAARVGVATGIVVVGDLIGMSARQEAVVVGETPNLAARLQSVAKPNQLVIHAEARALLSTAFDVAPLGMCDLKGVSHPVEAFVVNEEKAVESRFDARRSGNLTPLVGRVTEMQQITDLWAEAQAGKGHMLILDGEAGIGKSRVVRAAIDTLAVDSPIRVTFQCSPYHIESAFYPFVQYMRYTAGLTARDSNEMCLNKLEAVVQGSDETCAQMAVLLGLDGSARYTARATEPAKQRDQLMQTFVDFLLAKAAERPLLVVLEDLHWIDPTSLELLTRLLARLQDQRILVIATSRPPFEHDFGTDALLTRMTLDRLDPQMTRQIIDRVLGGKTLPKQIEKIIARQTDGVPLFVEELTRTILESGVLIEGGDDFSLEGSIDDIAIPSTLHDSLTARLDRLGPSKEIAQIAACVGREFDHRMLPQICDIPDAKLADGLDVLVDAGLLQRRGTPPQARYFFKHALVRDAAYEGLLKERRRPVHRRILAALETEPGTAPELLALHAEAAGLTHRAIDLWERAGTAAIARPAYQEGEAHLRRAIALNAPNVEAGEARGLHKALELHVQLSLALTPAKGAWSDEVVELLELALELAGQVGETPLRGDIIYSLLLGTYFQGSLELSVARADELEALAHASGDIAQLLVAKRLAAIGRINLGQFEQAQEHLDKAEALCREVADQDLTARFGHDPEVAVKVYQSLNATFQGRTSVAAAHLTQAMARADKIGHINTTSTLLSLAAISAQVAGDLPAETKHIRALQEITKTHEVPASRMWAEAGAGLLQLAEGDAGGLQTYRAAEQRLLDANIRLLVPGYRVLAAQRLWALGLAEEARDMANAAEALMQHTGERSRMPDVHCLHAAIAMSASDFGPAEYHLNAALQISRVSGGLLAELRAGTDLATLYHKTNRDAEARALLGQVTQKIKTGDCLPEMARVQQLVNSFDDQPVS